MLHGGGESRRLPAYAALGKVFLPMPAVDGLAPRRFDQMLADFQIPAYQQVLREAGAKAAVLVTAGDVWLDFDPLQIPAATADITGIGMRVAPEVARNFGVYFVARDQGRPEGCEHPIAFFRQKPAADEIHRLSARYDYYVDTGMWLLSLEALNVLFRRCGWDGKRGRFATADGHPRHMDLYTEIGSALGRETRAPDRLRRLGWSRLRAAVIPLEDARFYHLGSSRQLFESFEHIQRGKVLAAKGAPRGDAPVRVHEHRRPCPSGSTPWRRGRPIRLDGHNIVSGLPAQARVRWLGQGWCVEAAPVGARQMGPQAASPRRHPAGGRGRRRKDLRARRPRLARRARPAAGRPPTSSTCRSTRSCAPMRSTRTRWTGSLTRTPTPPSGRVSRATGGSPRRRSRRPWSSDGASRTAARPMPRCLRAEFEACLCRGRHAGLHARFCGHRRLRAARRRPALGRWLRGNGPRILPAVNRPEHASRLLMLLAGLSAGRRRSALAGLGLRAPPGVGHRLGRP